MPKQSVDSIISTTAKIGKNVIIEDAVYIGNYCVIGNNVTINKGTTIKDYVRVDDNVTIGKLPMKAVNSQTTTIKDLTPTIIGNKSIVGSGAIIYAGVTIEDQCLVADLATIREEVTVGEKTIIGRGVAIENKTTIGSRCKIQTNAYITAYSLIEDDCFIAPGVLTSNDAYVARDIDRFGKYKGITMKRGARIGVGAIILPGLTLYEDCLIGGGAVLTKDAKKETIYIGNPAKEYKKVPESQLLKNQ